MRFVYIVLLLCNTLSYSQTYTVASLDFTGLKKTKASYIRKITRTKPQQLLDSVRIEADIRRLKQLPFISYASYTVETNTATQKAKVTYDLKENFTIIPAVSIWTSDSDEFAYRLGLFEFNGLGRNITIGGFGQQDIFFSYGFRFKAPNLFGRRLGLALNYQDFSSEEPVFFNNTIAEYKYQNRSSEVSLLYQLNFTNIVEVGINYFNEKYEYLRGATDPAIPQNLDVDKIQYKFLYTYNSLEYNYQYLEGWKNILTVQYVHSADPGQEVLNDFVIAWNDILYFKRIGTTGNFASRLRLGIATNDETPFAPFSVDNNLNIRGVGNTIDRGTAAIVLNTEYRHTLFEKKWFVLQGNLFIDSGTWRNPGGELAEDLTDVRNVRVYPGAGIRLIHKKLVNATFRIDYGYGITENSSQGIVFGIGQYF